MSGAPNRQPGPHAGRHPAREGRAIRRILHDVETALVGLIGEGDIGEGGGRPLIVALSGGCDSSALLFCLADLQERGLAAACGARRPRDRIGCRAQEFSRDGRGCRRDCAGAARSGVARCRGGAPGRRRTGGCGAAGPLRRPGGPRGGARRDRRGDRAHAQRSGRDGAGAADSRRRDRRPGRHPHAGASCRGRPRYVSCGRCWG